GQQLTLPVAEQVGASLVAAAPAVTVPAQVNTAQPDAGDRLRIEDPQLLAVNEETEALHDRLQLLESRFHGLLVELEARDAQIAGLQAELDALRQARLAQQQAKVAEDHSGAAESPVQAAMAAEAAPG